MKVEQNSCRCHFETCNHYSWYITLDGLRLYGNDDEKVCHKVLEKIKAEIKKENNK